MNTVTASEAVTTTAVTPPLSTMAALEQDARWASAGAQEREVLKRIAMQRDRLAAAKQAKMQALALKSERDSVPAEAPFAERLMVFAKLHPVATAAVAGVALMIGPRKLLRFGALALPIVAKFKR